MILMNMEERARKRYEMKTEREIKRRAIEEEKLAKIQRTKISMFTLECSLYCFFVQK